MNFFGKSDIGNSRENNEDRFGVYPIGDNAYLFAVCDGMGGENAGEIAAHMALSAFSETVLAICKLHLKENKLSLTLREAELILANAAERANSILLSYEETHSECRGMGTTLVAALVCDRESIAWLNLGDSRLYTIDQKDILQVSKDHSYLQYMIDTGELTAKEAEKSPIRNLITRAVGIDKEVSPDVDLFELSPSEWEETTLLLCSDGLSGHLPEQTCMSIANRRDISLSERAELMLEEAKKNGSTDNITLILVELW